MLGQPVYFLTPDVVGVELTGTLREGVTATDLVLTVTEMLRKEKVVGKFVEFFGEGTASLVGARPRDDRQHGARVRRDDGLLPGRRRDRRLPDGHRPHRRTRSTRSRRTSRRRACSAFRSAGEIDYTKVLTLDLATIKPSLAGPKRPQDRIALGNLKSEFTRLFSAPVAERLRPARGEAREALPARNGKSAAGKISDSSMTLPRTGSRATSSRWSTTGRRRTGRATRAEAARHRQRRRADRRDHVVHEHVESRRAARRRSAREEGGREGPDGQAAHQDLARARLARRHRLPEQGRPAARTSRSSASASRPTAAPPASATPATSRRRSTRRSPRTTSSAPRCSPATATSRRASTRTSRRTSSRRRRSSSPTRSPARCCATSRPSRSAPARTARST